MFPTTKPKLNLSMTRQTEDTETESIETEVNSNCKTLWRKSGELGCKTVETENSKAENRNPGIVSLRTRR